MPENLPKIEQASNWSVMREFRQVVKDFGAVTALDMTDLSNHKRLENLFADYFGALGSESQRFDRPECLIYYRLAQICSPNIFRNPLGADTTEGLRYLKSPGTDINDPLYVISRETQNMNPGLVRLKSAYEFFPSSQIPQNFHPVILEYDIEGGNTPRIARVPLVLTGDPLYGGFLKTNLPMISRAAEAIKASGEVARVDVMHLPYLKSKMRDLKLITHQKNILDWPLEFNGIPLKTPIVAALLGDRTLDEDYTQFQSITVSVGAASYTWETIKKSWVLMQNQEVWKYWSFNNTVFQIRNIATQNMLMQSKSLAEDILAIDGIEMDKNGRSATLALHLPILLAATFAGNVPDGISSGLGYHQAEEDAITRQAREQEDRFWSNFSDY